MDSRKIKTPITYRPNLIARFWRLITVGICLSPTVGLLREGYVSNSRDFCCVIPIAFACYAFLVWWAFQSAFYNKLIIWEHGLEIYHDGIHSFALWEDMTKFGAHSRGKKTETGVFVSRFERQEMGTLARLFAFTNNFIPLNLIVPTPTVNIFNANLDVDRFSQTPFGQDLLHFAPHLFDDEKVKHNG